MKAGIIRGALVVLGLGVSHAAQGAVIYDNGGPDQVSGTNMSEQLVAENFTLGADTSITGIRFWSIQDAADSYRGSVYWAVYTDLPGEPGAILQSSTSGAVGSATGNFTGFGYAEYSFDIAVSFVLTAGDYWLVLHNGPVGDNDPSEMLWSTTAVPVGSESRYLDSTFGWVGTGNEQAFQLDGVAVTPGEVPEPSTLAMLFGGLLAARALRRKA